MVTPEIVVVSMSQSKKVLSFGLVVLLVIVGLFVWRAWGLGGMNTRNWPELQGGVYTEAVRFADMDYLVPPDEVYDSGLGKDGHPRLLEPSMNDSTTMDEKLIDEVRGLAVEVNGIATFYPFQILNWHEVVHDTVAGKPLLVTYSALTGSAVVYEPTVDGVERRFGDSGKVYNNASLLYDESSDTLWNQTSGQAIAGEDAGKKLTVYPSVVMRWDEWREAHPDGLVLSDETGYIREYGRHPYGGYETSGGIFFPVNNLTAEMLSLKDVVYRVDHGDEVGIFSQKYLSFQKEPNLMLGEGEDALAAVAFMDYDTFTTRIFDRQIGEQVLTFEREGKATIRDKETGTTWSLEGVALRGELAGQRLTLLPSSRHFAFAHYAMFPNSLLSGQDQTEVTDQVEEAEEAEDDETLQGDINVGE